MAADERLFVVEVEGHTASDALIVIYTYPAISEQHCAVGNTCWKKLL